MRLDNVTGMEAGYTMGMKPDGSELLVVCVKATYDYRHMGTLLFYFLCGLVGDGNVWSICADPDDLWLIFLQGIFEKGRYSVVKIQIQDLAPVSFVVQICPQRAERKRNLLARKIEKCSQHIGGLNEKNINGVQ